jgi:hypothetical protein
MFPMGGASRFHHRDGSSAFALPRWYTVSATATRIVKQPMLEARCNGVEDRRSHSLTSTCVHPCRQIRLGYLSPSTSVQRSISLDVARLLYTLSVR